MVSDLNSDTSATEAAVVNAHGSWLKMGALAAASALVGGLAAAWYYRKTLVRLRQAETQPTNSHNEERSEDPDYDIQ